MPLDITNIINQHISITPITGRVPEGCRAILHVWSTEMGECYDCGSPAAYEIERPNGASSRFCSVCAALLASEGEVIKYLF